MALDLLLTCLVVLSLPHALMERNYGSASTSTRGTDTAASYSVGGHSHWRQRPWIMLFREAEGVVVLLITSLLLVLLVIGGRTTN